MSHCFCFSFSLSYHHLSILPHCVFVYIIIWNDYRIRWCMAGMGSGYFCLLVIDQLSPHSHSHGGESHNHSHGHSHSHNHNHNHAALPVGSNKKVDEEVEMVDVEEERSRGSSGNGNDTAAELNSFSYTAFLGLAIHSFIDGVIIAGAFNASSSTGEAVGFAIVLHKFPDGLVLSSLLLSGQGNKVDWSKFYYIVIVAMMSPLGAILGLSLLADLSITTLGFTLGFGAGSFLFISCTGIMSELLEDTDYNSRMLSLISVIFGYGLFAANEALSGGHAH
eukprot:TRINITY_DN10099_c0_g1_i2.p1 TRINITY_DN10099_c0_g1~~TRINITY_DN10099_c0_g1_i2.p1  ORF type:complete len:289 (-),score=35.88 TRINITY_DN10099_c0_g1_i2:40-873(-)